MTNDADPPAEPAAREPLFNAPWTVMGLIAVLIGAHALRLLVGLPPQLFAYTAGDLAHGRWLGLVSHIFTHASWAHVLMNSAAVLAFGPPTARLMGNAPRGALSFLAFFLVCGALSAIGYAAIPAREAGALVGASGAASGLMGAAARLIEGRGRVGPLIGRTTIGMSAAWIIVNLLLGVSGLTPGAAGLPVAWQAHIIGFFAGLLLIGPFAWAAGAARDHAIAP